MIKFLKLKIDGFLSYAVPVVFNLSSEGITLISGPTGSGKSNIFEAVYYLLYGDTVRSKSSVSDLVHKSGKKKDLGYDIFLSFLVKDNSYEIQEIRGRDNSGLFFSKNGEDLRGPDTVATRKRIIEEFGIDEEDFRSMCFIGQEQSNALISGTPGVRAKEIVRIFGLDKYDMATKVAESDLKDLSSSKDKNEEELKKLDENIKSLETERDGIKIFDVDEDKLAVLEKKITDTEGKIDKIRDKEKGLISKKSEIEANERNFKLEQKLLLEVESLKKQADNIHIEEYSQELLDKIFTAEDTANKLLYVSRSNMEKATNTINVCPVNNLPCPSKTPEREKSTIIKNETEKVDKLLYKQKLLKQTKEIELKKKKDKENLSDINRKIKEHVKTLKQLKTDSQNLDTFSVLEGISRCQLGLEAGKKALSSLNASHQEMVDHKTVNVERRGQIGVIDQKLLTWTKTGASIRKGVEDLLKDISTCEQAVGVLKKLKAYKIESVFELLNINVAKNLSIVSNGDLSAEFITQKANSTGKKVLESIDIVVDDGIKKLSIGMVSGGQRAQVCIAVLLSVFETTRAISEKSISSLWLDEVFGPISLDVIDRVFEALVDLTRRIGVSSVKIITHKEIDTKMVDTVWKIKSVNGATEAEIQ